jgi:acyl-CoA hydrolase
LEKSIVEPIAVNTTRLVKSEDLNHHGTLFAGRTAEWFVESGFIAAASLLNPQGIVCLKIHGLYFSKPVWPGQILKFVSKVVYAGKSSLVSYIHVTNDGNTEPYVSGFITFIYVNEKTEAVPHHLEIQPKTEEDIALYERAKALKKK